MKEQYRVVVAAVIRNEAGWFLLARRHKADSNLPGFWSTPAGHIEANTHAADVLESNLVREVKEELGVEIGNLEYLDSHVWVEPGMKKLTVVFTASIVFGEPRPLEDTTEVEWFPVEEALRLELPPNVGRFLQKAAQQAKNGL
jgi:8-oxo-dGTP pyrophosphatase MutT (NUDIX family)